MAIPEPFQAWGCALIFCMLTMPRTTAAIERGVPTNAQQHAGIERMPSTIDAIASGLTCGPIGTIGPPGGPYPPGGPPPGGPYPPGGPPPGGPYPPGPPPPGGPYPPGPPPPGGPHPPGG